MTLRNSAKYPIHMKLEACIETLAEARVATKHHINRVELCSALDLGGLTPTSTLISACAEVIEVHAMIRPRPGNFVYNTEEMALMLTEIAAAKEAGATGVVFGCLTHDSKIDFAMAQHIVLAAQKLNLKITFHRAFDFLEDQEAGLKLLIDLGVDRVLTSGGKPTAIEGIKNIQKLVEIAEDNIEIMAGSGVNAHNIITLKNIDIHAAHFSIRKKTGEVLPLGMGENYEVDVEKMNKILELLK